MSVSRQVIAGAKTAGMDRAVPGLVSFSCSHHHLQPLCPSAHPGTLFMAPTTANQRPARHAFNKAVRGVIGQTNSGDATMKDVPPASGPVRSRVSARKKHTIKDAMQVEHAAKISKV